MAKRMADNQREQKITKERTQPFAPLAKVLNDDFKELCVQLLFLIRENAISLMQPNLENKEELLKFATYVHQGWKEAQLIVIERVLHNLDQLENLQKQFKEARRSRKKDEIKKIHYELNGLKTENTVMRRMIDAIAWGMLKNELSTIRRLSTKGAQTNFSAYNIRDAVSTLDLYNENDHQIALCCDLSTFIHVGDILLFDYQTGITAFVELKSGEKNMALTELATISTEAKCDIFEKEVYSRLSDTDRKHFERLKKQVQVGKAVTDIINNEQGVDHRTGEEVRIFSTTHEPRSYGSKIVSCYEQLDDKKTWAIDTIDECLHIGVYTDVNQAFVAFNGWMDLIKCSSPIRNITDSFRTSMVTPFAALNLPTELLERVIKGEITIIICLDINRFVEMSNSMFPDLLAYANRKETAEADRGHVIPLKVDGRAVRSSRGVVGVGLLDRIIFELQSPKQIIKMFKQMWDEELKNDSSA